VDVDDNGAPGFNTAYGRAKPRHIERDPRVTLTVVNPADGYQWLSVTGTASLVDEGADAQIDKLAKKYLDADSYPFRKPDERRVSVPIAPEKVEAHGI
jgi:PPOX class probable F420-dependent enzyme